MNKEIISKSLKTVLEMLSDRKIDVSNINKDGFSEWIDNNFNKSIFSIILNKIKVLYYLPDKFKWPEIKKVFDEEENVYDLTIIIVKDKVSPGNLKSINALNIPYQLFDIQQLKINVTRHELVPPHILLNEQETNEFLELYSMKNKKETGTILRTDPIAKYMGFKSGDIIKIIRNSESAGEYITYRHCV